MKWTMTPRRNPKCFNLTDAFGGTVALCQVPAAREPGAKRAPGWSSLGVHRMKLCKCCKWQERRPGKKLLPMDSWIFMHLFLYFDLNPFCCLVLIFYCKGMCMCSFVPLLILHPSLDFHSAGVSLQVLGDLRWSFVATCCFTLLYFALFDWFVALISRIFEKREWLDNLGVWGPKSRHDRNSLQQSLKLCNLARVWGIGVENTGIYVVCARLLTQH